MEVRMDMSRWYQWWINSVQCKIL